MEPSVSEVVRISQALFSDVLEFEYLCYHTTELETYLRSTGVVVRARRGVGRLINRKRMLVLELLHVTIQEIIRDFENGTSIFASEAEFWRDPRSSEERAAQGL